MHEHQTPKNNKNQKRVCGKRVWGPGGMRRGTGGKQLIQGKRIPQRSEECSVALVRGSRCRTMKAAQPRAEDECLYKVHGTGVNTPDRIFRRGAVEAIMGPWLIGAAGCRVSRRIVELSERPCSHSWYAALAISKDGRLAPVKVARGHEYLHLPCGDVWG